MARTKSFRLPKLRLHKASGRGVVELSGKQHYLGPYDTAECQAAYDKLVGEWLACGKRPVEVTTRKSIRHEARGLAVVQLVERYLDHAANYYTSNGQPTRGLERVKIAARIVTEHYAATPLAEFGPLKLRAIQELLIEQDRSRRYINVLCGEDKRMFKWGVSMEFCPPGTYHALQAVAGLKYGRSGARETKRILPVSEEALNATIPELGKIVRDMVEVQLLGAMRPQEVCMMRPADIDRKSDVWLYKPRHHKTAHYGRDRIIPLGAAAQAILLPYLLRPAESYIFSPLEAEAQHRAARAEKRQTPIGYGNSPGTNRVKKPRRRPHERFTVATYGRAITRAGERAFPAPKGLKVEAVKQWNRDHRWRPNMLRHLAATQLRAQFGIEGTQAFMGHASPQTTLIYAEQDLVKITEMARRRAK